MLNSWNKTPLNRLMILGATAGGKPVEDTATGNPLSFLTDLAKPLKSLLVPFTPKQTGSGDPSPINIRPIVPWNGVTVNHSGADTSEYTETDISFPSPVYGGTLDVVSGVLTVTHKTLDTVWSAGETSGEFTNVIRKVFIFDDVLTGSNAKTRICNIAKYSVNYSSDTVHYYIGTTGGHGVAYVFLPVDTPADTPIQVCEELVTPITIQLTPSQITALVGNNTLWSDADGEMTAIYYKKG